MVPDKLTYDWPRPEAGAGVLGGKCLRSGVAPEEHERLVEFFLRPVPLQARVQESLARLTPAASVVCLLYLLCEFVHTVTTPGDGARHWAFRGNAPSDSG